MKGIDITFGCLLEFEGKTLLLKTSHALDTGLGGIKLEVTCRLSPGLFLRESEGSMQAAKG